jgi:hypothetical protein
MSGGVVRPVAAILCDQIRIELGDKLIALGCVGPNITVSSFPTNLMTFTILWIVDVIKAGDTEFLFEIRNSSIVLAGGNATVQTVKAEKGTVMPGPTFPVIFEGPDSLTFCFRENEDEPWIDVMSWNFEAAV